MRLIVGLGNPGTKYAGTRHNLGNVAVRLLARAHAPTEGIKWDNWQNQAWVYKITVRDTEARLVLPTCFMNESGPVVQKLLHFYKVELKDLWIVHDDVDLPFGAIRLSWQSSSAGHHGGDSIIESLATNEFWRWRLGVGRPGEDMPTDKYVLQAFTDSELTHLPDFLSQVVTKLKTALAQGLHSSVQRK